MSRAPPINSLFIYFLFKIYTRGFFFFLIQKIHSLHATYD